VHVPVLLREVLAQLDLQPGLIVVDGTVGAAGHSRELVRRISPGGRLIGLDRDPMMLRFAAAAIAGEGVDLVHSTYRDLRTVLDSLSLPTVDRVLLDLGLSSDQLADRERGFGFDAGGTLDMRFDRSRGQSAADWLASAPEEELVSAFEDWGEVPHARSLASEIVARRRNQRFETAADLCDVIQSAGGGRSGGRPFSRDAAAPVFQALRIAVNEELSHLETFLREGLPQSVAEGGRAAIISFHSIEDRLVKQALRPEHGWTPVTKKPIEPTPAEVRVNPRSRSARLRVAVRATS
jgi:16S rRNA (cytosine1402-N4)-methyltransferase